MYAHAQRLYDGMLALHARLLGVWKKDDVQPCAHNNANNPERSSASSTAPAARRAARCALRCSTLAACSGRSRRLASRTPPFPPSRHSFCRWTASRSRNGSTTCKLIFIRRQLPTPLQTLITGQRLRRCLASPLYRPKGSKSSHTTSPRRSAAAVLWQSRRSTSRCRPPRGTSRRQLRPLPCSPRPAGSMCGSLRQWSQAAFARPRGSIRPDGAVDQCCATWSSKMRRRHHSLVALGLN